MVSFIGLFQGDSPISLCPMGHSVVKRKDSVGEKVFIEKSTSLAGVILLWLRFRISIEVL